MSRSKAIGTSAETAVVRALRTHGYPHAERRALAGVHDLGDITGTPGVCWEVKGGDAARTASDNQIADWMAETEKERANASADIGVLVIQRKGVGAANAHRWWAYTTSAVLAQLMEPSVALYDEAPIVPVRMLLADLTQVLRWAGYGEPLPEQLEVPA
ncbi:hypothetical protein ACIBG4_40505 [Nonomuraea sp. NPDC050383]|uniref:hypothetical protein n=1 Tax=Nonomuraea sp. NPDC050383 TaxID=3364362 RepID=UPI00378DA5C8